MYVTDNSGATRGWRLRTTPSWKVVLAGGLSVLTAATVTVVAHTADPASADTYLASVRNAVIRLADGTEHTAEVGDQLPKGAQLRTGEHGGAELFTAGRSVYVGAVSTIDVVDGVRQKLERGQVMVDSRKGARLELGTLAGEVASRAGALTRIETAAVLRLGVFEGSATITATGRRASTTVNALHQVQVPYGYLPGQVTALALTGDSWESRLASALVTADQDLQHLAASLGGTDGVRLLTVAPAALRTSPIPPAGAGRGEEALSVALAQAAGRDVAGTYSEVRTARTEGGSWGVVAALVGAQVSRVSALLDLALSPEAGPGTVIAAIPAADLPGLLNAGPAQTPSPSTSSPRPKPRVTASPRPTTSPSPTPDVVDGVVQTVQDLLGPTPSPSSAVAPTATPSPLLNLDLDLGLNGR